MNKLLYMTENGDISIVIPASKEKVEEILGIMSYDEYRNHIISKSIPDGLSFIEIDDSVIPRSREFRNAWEYDKNKKSIEINLNKAINIQLERLRFERNEILKKYDGLTIKAIDTSDDQLLSDVKIKKQLLRDSTNCLKKLFPESIDDIKSATPDLSKF
jgi:hypothetical protein